MLVAVLWALVISPNRSIGVPDPVAFVLALVVLELAAAALASSGKVVLGLAFGVVAVVNGVLMLVWRQ